MQQLAEAESGRVFVDRDGNLNLWNKTHMATASGSQFTMSMKDHITDFQYDINDNKVYNSISVKAKPREVQSNQSVWTLETAIELKPGVQTDIWAEIKDQNGVGLPCPTVTAPSAGGSTSTYTANSALDGTGVSKTSKVTLASYYNFGVTYRMTFENSDSMPVYLTEVILYGTPAKVKSDINITVEDSDSVAIYGRQQLQIENDLIQSEGLARSIAADKLETYKNPINTVKISNVGIPYLELGDTITVEDNFDERFQDYKIVSHCWQLLKDGDFNQSLDLQKFDQVVFFQLDQSQLDMSDKLYI
jgi:hypothetical protein